MKCFILGGVTENDLTSDVINDHLKDACTRIGKVLSDSGHSLVICSPFQDSADYWALSGFTQNMSNSNSNNSTEIHYVDTESIRNEICTLESAYNTHKIIKIPYPAPNIENKDSISLAWLLCQLNALESCHVVIAIGGKTDGVANMLLLLAEAKRKPIIPLSFLGGAAGQAFHRRRYELEDRLGADYLLLQDQNSIDKVIENLDIIHKIQNDGTSKSSNPKFFISYPRSRPSEADYIETLLRRRNLQVYRDESDFGAGSEIPTEITEAIHAADIFVAIWCVDYACSPWCFDEFELALDRHNSSKLKLWILCVDETRIIPKRARDLNYFNVCSRDEIEGRILSLLEQYFDK